MQSDTRMLLEKSAGAELKLILNLISLVTIGSSTVPPHITTPVTHPGK